LARETAIVAVNAFAPTNLTILKQSNSLSYNETLLALDVVCPDEIVLNDGRKSSALQKKILNFYSEISPQPQDLSDSSAVAKDSSLPTNTNTIVKLISRANFDQTKGADLLCKVARHSTFNSDMLTEFIIPSAANAALTYTQSITGTIFAPHCLSISLNSSELNNRMTIDRSTVMNLELLTNAR